MKAESFRAHLQQQLQSSSHRPLLRVITSRAENSVVEMSGAEVLERSLKLADLYCDAPESGVVLVLLPHCPELFLLHIGLILRGRLPAILAWPTSRVNPLKYQVNLSHQLQGLPATQLITLPKLAQSLDRSLPYRVTECPIENSEQIERSFAAFLDIPPVQKRRTLEPAADTPKEALFLQFSGGTTGAQKCVVVNAPMLVNQLQRLSGALDFSDRDTVVSWLPMYHDMGLIACLWLPLWNGAPSVQVAATDWLMDPDMLFRLMSEFHGTFCWLPNFAFSYLAEHQARMHSPVDLSHVRAWINCSEPVRAKSFRAFTDAFSHIGVRSNQCQSSYAMAENVFAVSQSPLHREPKTVPRAAIAGLEPSTRQVAYEMLDDTYVSSGQILEGTEVRIRDTSGNLRGNRAAGSIEIRGESLFYGYWGNDGFSRRSMTVDGWYDSGDYGFIDGEELYVIGRKKDIIIVSGKNLFPEDIEMLTKSIEGVYPGRAVAFGVDDPHMGTESLAVVVEMRGAFDPLKAREIEREIHRLVQAALGVFPHYVWVVPERWIIKSTAGKISRRENRQRFLTELADKDTAKELPAPV